MASRIEWSVNATPIVTISDAEALIDADVLSTDIGKVLSASGTVTGVGFSTGTNLANVNVTTATALEAAGAAHIWIKHRGVTDTGVATASTLALTCGAQEVCTLAANEGIFFPRLDGSSRWTATSSSGTISVEVGYHGD